MNRTCFRVFGLLLPGLAAVASHSSAQEQKYQLFYGDNLQSKYSVTKQDGRQVMSAQIFDQYGKPRSQPGQIMFGRIVTPGASGKSDTDKWTMNREGFVWTPRVEKIQSVDLASEAKITEQQGFDFEVFRRHEAVIEFKNGYAINLYGARNKDGRIREAGKEGTYLTKTGRKLYPRLIVKKLPGEVAVNAGDAVVTARRAPLMVVRTTLAVIEPGTSLVAKQVEDEWVAVSVQQAGKTVTGWINKQHLTVPGKEFEERILKVEDRRD